MRIKHFNPNGISILEVEDGTEIRVQFFKADGLYNYTAYEVESPEHMWVVQFVGTNKSDDICTWREDDLIILGHQV